MLKSMTGFGRAEGETPLGKVSVEIRSTNQRYCDINLKLPKRFLPFEARIKERIRAEVSRGRLDVSLQLDTTQRGRVQLQVDLPLAEQYYHALQTLKQKLQLSDEISLSMFTGVKDLISGVEEQEDVEPYWREITPILAQSLRELDRMKQSEGESLRKDIEQRLERINREIEAIKRIFPSNLEAYRNRLHERVTFLLRDIDLDRTRFEQEVAYLTERSDITEEVVRTESHLRQFVRLLDTEEPMGRKLDFLIQEIHREVNTMSAKANDAEISQRVVEIKSELEKIREQVQNVE